MKFDCCWLIWLAGLISIPVCFVCCWIARAKTAIHQNKPGMKSSRQHNYVILKQSRHAATNPHSTNQQINNEIWIQFNSGIEFHSDWINDCGLVWISGFSCMPDYVLEIEWLLVADWLHSSIPEINNEIEVWIADVSN